MAQAQPQFTGDIAGALSATLAWWREAGISHAFLDSPQGWLAETSAAAAVAEPSRSAPAARQAALPPPRPFGDPSAWPQELAAFQAWWLTEPALAPGPIESRVPPRGPQGARLMALVPEPEAEDGETLLTGPQGKLLSAILRAMGVAEAEVYVAAALPRRLPGADWQALASQGLGEVLRHHIALAAPARVVVFGAGVLPLLGHDPTQSAAVLPIVNQEGSEILRFDAPALATMLERAGAKAAFWRRWLEWTGQLQG